MQVARLRCTVHDIGVRFLTMTSSSDPANQLSEDLIGLIKANAELRRSLAAIAEEIHNDAAGAQQRTINAWEDWLVENGYNRSGIQTYISKVLECEELSQALRTVNREASVGELIMLLESNHPMILNAIMESVDKSIRLDEEIRGISGGTARASIAGKLRSAQNNTMQRNRELALREVSAESRASISDRRSISDSSRESAIVGGREPNEQARIASREQRDNALTRGRDSTDIQSGGGSSVDGRNGAGEEAPYARTIEALRSSLERPEIILGPGGDERNITRLVDSLRVLIDRREVVYNSGQDSRLSIAVDIVRRVLAEAKKGSGSNSPTPRRDQERSKLALDIMKDEIQFLEIRANEKARERTVDAMELDTGFRHWRYAHNIAFRETVSDLDAKTTRLFKQADDQTKRDVENLLVSLKKTANLLERGLTDIEELAKDIDQLDEMLNLLKTEQVSEVMEASKDMLKLRLIASDLDKTLNIIRDAQRSMYNLWVDEAILRSSEEIAKIEITEKAKEDILDMLKQAQLNTVVRKSMFETEYVRAKQALDRASKMIAESRELESLLKENQMIIRLNKLLQDLEKMTKEVALETREAVQIAITASAIRRLPIDLQEFLRDQSLERLDRKYEDLLMDVRNAMSSIEYLLELEKRVERDGLDKFSALDTRTALDAVVEQTIEEICFSCHKIEEEIELDYIQPEDRELFIDIAALPKRMLESDQEEINRILFEMKEKVTPYNANGYRTIGDRLNELTRLYRRLKDVEGRNGAGEEKEYARILDGLQISALITARAEFNQTRPGMMGDGQASNLIDGPNGVSANRIYQNLINLKDSLERVEEILKVTEIISAGEQDEQKVMDRWEKKRSEDFIQNLTRELGVVIENAVEI
jgi:hypothetical protein